MSFRKLLLTLFLSLMLYAQAYSLVVGLQSATILNPERLEDMQDTDLEDIVTFDPFLPSRAIKHTAVTGGFSSDWQSLPSLLAGLACLFFWLCRRIFSDKARPLNWSDFCQNSRLRPLYLQNRQLLL